MLTSRGCNQIEKGQWLLNKMMRVSRSEVRVIQICAKGHNHGDCMGLGRGITMALLLVYVLEMYYIPVTLEAPIPHGFASFTGNLSWFHTILVCKLQGIKVTQVFLFHVCSVFSNIPL